MGLIFIFFWLLINNQIFRVGFQLSSMSLIARFLELSLNRKNTVGSVGKIQKVTALQLAHNAEFDATLCKCYSLVEKDHLPGIYC